MGHQWVAGAEGVYLTCSACGISIRPVSTVKHVGHGCRPCVVWKVLGSEKVGFPRCSADKRVAKTKRKPDPKYVEGLRKCSQCFCLAINSDLCIGCSMQALFKRVPLEES